MLTRGALSSYPAYSSLLLRPSAIFRRRRGNPGTPSDASLVVLHPSSPAATRAVALVVKSGRSNFAEHSKWGSSTDGFWEEPDDGYSSDEEGHVDREDEDDEEEEEEERIQDEGKVKPSASGGDRFAMPQYEELLREVEMLLEPEERVILQQNELPDLTKISTVKLLQPELLKWNPFHNLALSDQIPLMDKLLERGTDINCLDKDGFTALHKAIIGKKEAVISHLLRKGANPHVRDRGGATPLHHAVQVGAMQTVKLLIKYKVDVNVADNDGWTPLHVAVQCRSRDIAKVLLINGADKTRRNMDGKTPLDLSLCFGKDFKSYELAKLLKVVPANREP